MAKFDCDGCRVPQTSFEAAAWRYSIVADCKACRARGVFHAAALWWLFERKGCDTMLGAVARRLRCRACGGRARLSVSHAVPTVILELPGERDWKRAVSRFRS
jgi:hypothetical protein